MTLVRSTASAPKYVLGKRSHDEAAVSDTEPTVEPPSPKRRVLEQIRTLQLYPDIANGAQFTACLEEKIAVLFSLKREDGDATPPLNVSYDIEETPFVLLYRSDTLTDYRVAGKAVKSFKRAIAELGPFTLRPHRLLVKHASTEIMLEFAEQTLSGVMDAVYGHEGERLYLRVATLGAPAERQLAIKIGATSQATLAFQIKKADLNIE